MLIGKAGALKSAICTADETSIAVRGRDLCGDLMGGLSFTDFFLLHLTGRAPTADQAFFLDAMLVGLAEHGVTPSVQAARMTLAAAPESLQGAVAAGIAGAGSVVLGAAEEAGRLLARGVAEAGGNAASFETAARRIATEIRAARRPIPGFGHPLHKPDDPRATRLLALAHDRGIVGDHTRFLEVLAPVVNDIWQRTLPVNINGAIAAIMLDLDFPMEALRGVPILARTASLLGHLYEETQRPMGFLLAHHAEAAVEYDGEPPPSEQE
ncbi:MAG: citryl-CoA lyase [Rhodospirillaceae bacterium]|nr:citryl-CoA lyase [Rhodospirillaceae bacterium]